MDTLGELVARERRGREPALRAGTDANPRYDYHQFCTTAHKTGNFLSHRGVHAGSTVAIVGEESGAPLLSLFGTALLGARVRFDPPPEVDTRVLVAPADRIAEYDLPPGTSRIAYEGEIDDPETEAFGESVWSENPYCPTPSETDRDTPALVTADRTYTHGELLDAAVRVVEHWDLDSDDAVAVRAPLARAETVVAGVLAPLSVGATVVVPDDDAETTIAVGNGPEPTSIEPESVEIP